MPEGAFERRVAALLFCWAVDGWLLPTLLLIRREAQHKPWPQVGAGDSAAEGLRGRIATAWSRLGCMLYTQLSKLLPARQQRQQQRRTGEPEEQSSGDGGSTAPEGMLLLLRWWLVLVATWAVCCSAAPLFEELPPTQLAPSAS